LFLAGCLAIAGRLSAAPIDLYKEAQLQETATRDCDAAIRLYEQFLQLPNTPRAEQSQAWLHLGVCQAKTGQMDAAQASWKKVGQDYSDQPDAYAESLRQLQKNQPVVRVVEVRESSPIVKLVYEAPPAHWFVEFPRAAFLQTLDGKGDLTDNAAGVTMGFIHFPQPNLGVGFEFGSFGNAGPNTARREINVLSVLVRAEKPLVKGLIAYAKGGPGVYFYKFDHPQGDEDRANLGAALETGLVVGLARGFTFSFGLALHAFGQSTPSDGFIADIPAGDRAAAEPITRNRGLRLAGGPTLSLSFRW